MTLPEPVSADQSSRWQVVRALVDDALQLATPVRAAFLAGATSDLRCMNSRRVDWVAVVSASWVGMDGPDGEGPVMVASPAPPRRVRA